MTDVSEWKHVNSPDNPADLISGRVLPAALKESDSWWHGTNYLLQDSKQWSIEKFEIDFDIPEQRKCVNSITNNDFIANDLLQRFSSLKEFLRVLGFCFRFINNCLARIRNKNELFGVLNPKELEDTMHFLINSVQGQCFAADYRYLQKADDDKDMVVDSSDTDSASESERDESTTSQSEEEID
ncbi:hypothetical protein JTB14_002148 [Gonioctena quinquepunctata]|nr:hypothetical protein JTB14_002148 [Gonioctena quinquepunctata]